MLNGHCSCGRRLAGDEINAVYQKNRVIVHRPQAASHSPVFAVRERYVEDVVAPPTVSFAAKRHPIHGCTCLSISTSLGVTMSPLLLPQALRS